MARPVQNLSQLEYKLIYRFGPRGVCLLIFGFMWVMIGIAFIINPMERFSKPGPGGALDFLDKGPGVYIFASMWIVGGVAAFITAFLRPVTCKDDVGFNGAALPPFFWGAGYWWSFFIHNAVSLDYGRSAAYVAGLLYWTLTLLVVFLSRHLSDHPEGPCARRRAKIERVS